MAYFDYNGKKIYYQELGSGTPCVFLHGNTASSKMFEFLLPLYRDDMKIILIIIRERQAAKKDEQARGFYEWCQGDDWEMVVDLDTEALVNYEKKHVRIFRAPIETIQVPLMITVSREDEMLANDMEAECRRLHEANPDISYHVFDTGGHPLIATRAEEIARIIKEFLCDD